MKPLTVNEIHRLLNRISVGGLTDEQINQYIAYILTRNNNKHDKTFNDTGYTG